MRAFMASAIPAASHLKNLFRSLKSYVLAMFGADSGRVAFEADRLFRGGATTRMLPYLAMGTDAADGCLQLSDGAIDVEWSHRKSRQLFAEIEKRNTEAEVQQYPIVKTAPLPAGAQFLNVIESVFSGMSRAIIHNSDYPSIEAAKQAIDTHFSNRNKNFREHPRRAGGKIWGSERVSNEFRASNNCKDPLYR